MSSFSIQPRAATLALSLSLPFLASSAEGQEPLGLAVEGSLGGPSRVLTIQEWSAWLHGRELFEREWTAPTGLGTPGFNAESCATCHRDPATGGAGGEDFDVVRRVGTGYVATPVQAQLRGNDRQIAFRLLAAGRSVRAEPFNQLERLRRALAEADPELAPALFDVFQTPSLLGLGGIDRIPDEEIRRREDPEDRDGDGVRGVAVNVRIHKKTEVGRFGWEARTPHLADFVCMALAGETGITAPDQGRGFGLAEDGDAVPDPELSQTELDRLVFYVTHLAPPERRGGAGEPRVRRGEELFAAIGCAVCHVPALEGGDGQVPLYSDLLLHGVLARPTLRIFEDDMPRTHEEFHANDPKPMLIRTPPLWGVSRTAPYLHDGRAATLYDAVVAHGGEADASRYRFEALPAGYRAALVAFLEDL